MLKRCLFYLIFYNQNIDNMCLLTHQSNIIKADKDIHGYKIVAYNAKLKSYHTPFTITQISNVCIKGNNLFKSHGGVIHVYGTERGAIQAFFSIQKHINPCAEIWEVIIPKGTEYYSGKDENFFCLSFGAKQIRFVKKLR